MEIHTVDAGIGNGEGSAARGMGNVTAVRECIAVK